MPGVVLQLVDSIEVVRARVLSGIEGSYFVRAPAPGSYRLRALRIGYRPEVSAVFLLAEGETRELPFQLTAMRVELAPVRVAGAGVCGRRAGGDPRAVFTAWDQAMTSVAAAAIVAATSAFDVTIVAVDRTLESNGRRVREQVVSVQSGPVRQPWGSLSPEAFRAYGYSTADERGEITFQAPGLDVLASSVFLEDHCLRAIASRDTSEVGVAFDPTPARREEAAIRGSLWLSRATSELRRLEFAYVNVPGWPTALVHDAGGAMSFARLGDGSVAISRWEIRMPELERPDPLSPRIRVAAVRTVGGEVILARRGADTLFRRPPLVVAGTVLDSTSGRPVAGARVRLIGTASAATSRADGRFELSDVLPGEYGIAVSTPSLDSIRATIADVAVILEGSSDLVLRVPTAAELAARFCGRTLQGNAASRRGAVLGTVGDAAESDLGGIRVIADWVETLISRGGAVAIFQERRSLETRTDASGSFRLCGVPTEALLRVQALPAQGRSDAVSVRLAPDQRFASVRVMIDRTRPGLAVFRGVVVADSTRLSLAGVEVTLPALGFSVRTDSAGAFRIPEIPPGTHRIVARRLGFGALDTELPFTANGEVERRIVLARITELSEVEIIATPLDQQLLQFEENRRTGLGRFLTREELAAKENLRMSSLLAALPAVTFSGQGARAYLMSRRFIPTPGATAVCDLDSRFRSLGSNSPIYVPTAAEKSRGVACACYAQVYVDGALMNPGIPAEPFDVNSIPVAQIEAVEWYASPASIPARYLALNSTCGVYVIHTRRPEPRREAPPPGVTAPPRTGAAPSG